jgi:hypothetical protein
LDKARWSGIPTTDLGAQTQNMEIAMQKLFTGIVIRLKMLCDVVMGYMKLAKCALTKTNTMAMKTVTKTERVV